MDTKNEMQSTPRKKVAIVSTVKKRKKQGDGNEAITTSAVAFNIYSNDNKKNGHNHDNLQIPMPPPLKGKDEMMFMSLEKVEGEEIAQQQIYSSKCRGVSKLSIDNTNVRDKEIVRKGHAQLVGNAFRQKGSYLANNDAVWTNGRAVAGYLENQNCSGDYTWVCIENDEDPNKITYAFAHKECSGNSENGKQLCSSCEAHKYRLFEMCRKETNQREQTQENPILNGRHDYLKHKSPSIILPHIKAQAERVKVLGTKIWRRDYALAALVAKEVEVSGLDEEKIFEYKTLKEGYDILTSKAEVHEKEIFAILFQECETVVKRIQKHGNAKGHSYSPLLIRFAIMLRNKVSQSNYDFLRQVFGLPTNATLCHYSKADTTAEDGIMHETCYQQAVAMHQQNVPMGDFRWYMSLSFDSHTIKEMLGTYT